MRNDYSITLKQVTELEGRGRTWVFKNAKRLGTHYNGAVGKRDKKVPFFDVRCLSPEAYRKWERGQKVVSIVVEPREEDLSPGQLSLDLVTPSGVKMSPEDQVKVDARHKVIAPVLSWDLARQGESILPEHRLICRRHKSKCSLLNKSYIYEGLVRIVLGRME